MAVRDMAATQGLIGYFINVVPIRNGLPVGTAFAELVRSTSTTTLQGMEHSLLPFQQVVEVVGVRRQPGINPIFQASQK